MRYPSIAVLSVAALGLTVAAGTEGLSMTQTSGQGQAAIYTPEDVNWQEGPATLPPGARFVVLEGDPSTRGEYFALRIELPDGYEIPPHWHPVPERVTVLSGTFHLGMGDQFDGENTRRLPAGSFFTMPAEMRHFAWADGDTVIQLNSIGPFEINYVNPEDDPRNERD